MENIFRIEVLYNKDIMYTPLQGYDDFKEAKYVALDILNNSDGVRVSGIRIVNYFRPVWSLIKTKRLI